MHTVPQILEQRRIGGLISPYHGVIISRLGPLHDAALGTSCTALTFCSDDGDAKLVVGDETSRLQLWRPDYAGGNVTTAFDTGLTGSVLCVRFLVGSGGSRLVCCSTDRQVRLIDLQRQATRPFLCHRARVKALASVSPDVFLSASEDGTVRLFDIRQASGCRTSGNFSAFGDTPSLLVEQRCERSGRSSLRISINSLAVSPLEPHLFVTGGGDPFARLYDMRMLGSGAEQAFRAGATGSVRPSWVSCFAPHQMCSPSLVAGSAAGFSTIGRVRHLTGLAFAAGGQHLLLSYSGDAIYSVCTRAHAMSYSQLEARLRQHGGEAAGALPSNGRTADTVGVPPRGSPAPQRIPRPPAWGFYPASAVLPRLAPGGYTPVGDLVLDANGQVRLRDNIFHFPENRPAATTAPHTDPHAHNDLTDNAQDGGGDDSMPPPVTTSSEDDEYGINGRGGSRRGPGRTAAVASGNGSETSGPGGRLAARQGPGLGGGGSRLAGRRALWVAGGGGPGPRTGQAAAPLPAAVPAVLGVSERPLAQMRLPAGTMTISAGAADVPGSEPLMPPVQQQQSPGGRPGHEQQPGGSNVQAVGAGERPTDIDRGVSTPSGHTTRRLAWYRYTLSPRGTGTADPSAIAPAATPLDPVPPSPNNGPGAPAHGFSSPPVNRSPVPARASRQSLATATVHAGRALALSLLSSGDAVAASPPPGMAVAAAAVWAGGVGPSAAGPVGGAASADGTAALPAPAANGGDAGGADLGQGGSDVAMEEGGGDSHEEQQQQQAGQQQGSWPPSQQRQRRRRRLRMLAESDVGFRTAAEEMEGVRADPTVAVPQAAAGGAAGGAAAGVAMGGAAEAGLDLVEAAAAAASALADAVAATAEAVTGLVSAVHRIGPMGQVLLPDVGLSEPGAEEAAAAVAATAACGGSGDGVRDSDERAQAQQRLRPARQQQQQNPAKRRRTQQAEEEDVQRQRPPHDEQQQQRQRRVPRGLASAPDRNLSSALAAAGHGEYQRSGTAGRSAAAVAAAAAGFSGPTPATGPRPVPDSGVSERLLPSQLQSLATADSSDDDDRMRSGSEPPQASDAAAAAPVAAALHAADPWPYTLHWRSLEPITVSGATAATNPGSAAATHGTAGDRGAAAEEEEDAVQPRLRTATWRLGGEVAGMTGTRQRRRAATDVPADSPGTGMAATRRSRGMGAGAGVELLLRAAGGAPLATSDTVSAGAADGSGGDSGGLGPGGGESTRMRVGGVVPCDRGGPGNGRLAEGNEPEPAGAGDGGYLRCFDGHKNVMTTKEVVWMGGSGFGGPSYVASGSDEGYVFIWEYDTGEVVRMLPMRDHVIPTSLAIHPFEPMIAACGMGTVVKLWGPGGSRCGAVRRGRTATATAAVGTAAPGAVDVVWPDGRGRDARGNSQAEDSGLSEPEEAGLEREGVRLSLAARQLVAANREDRRRRQAEVEAGGAARGGRTVGGGWLALTAAIRERASDAAALLDAVRADLGTRGPATAAATADDDGGGLGGLGAVGVPGTRRLLGLRGGTPQPPQRRQQQQQPAARELPALGDAAGMGAADGGGELATPRGRVLRLSTALDRQRRRSGSPEETIPAFGMTPPVGQFRGPGRGPEGGEGAEGGEGEGGGEDGGRDGMDATMSPRLCTIM